MSRAQLETWFPGLRETPWQVTSTDDTSYNCIAWAAGGQERCWWPVKHPRYYWPREPRIASLSEFVEVFASLGYAECSSREMEEEFEKVAIYANDEGPSHMARQLPSGLWTSKCGDFEDIVHTLEALEGRDYGRVVTVMKRRRNAKIGRLGE